MAVVPETAEGYVLTLGDKAKAALGDLGADPLVKALQEHALEQKWPQGQFDILAKALDVAAEKGLLEPAIVPETERAALGANGETRMKDAETHLQALKERGDIDADMYGEAMTLVQTAAGTKFLEYMRQSMGKDTAIVPPKDGGGMSKDALMADWKARRAVPQYDDDPKYRAAIDAEFQRIHAMT